MRAKRSLGQNFLVDGNLQRKIVEALDPAPSDEVLEIGPGRGALTRHLVGSVGRLILVELDDDLAEALSSKYGARDDVVVVHDDILEVELGRLSRDLAALKVVGNIPYNITAPIVFKLLEQPRPREILIMVQREVAERMVATPDDGKTYGALAVGVQSVAEAEEVLRVPRQAFRPVPNVDSSVVRIVPRTPPPLSPDEEADLRVLTRAAFQWRRKQFQKILRTAPDFGLDHAGIDELEKETGLSLVQRPERLTPRDFVELADALRRRGYSGGSQ